MCRLAQFHPAHKPCFYVWDWCYQGWFLYIWCALFSLRSSVYCKLDTCQSHQICISWIVTYTRYMKHIWAPRCTYCPFFPKHLTTWLKIACWKMASKTYWCFYGKKKGTQGKEATIYVGTLNCWTGLFTVYFTDRGEITDKDMGYCHLNKMFLGSCPIQSRFLALSPWYWVPNKAATSNLSIFKVLSMTQHHFDLRPPWLCCGHSIH